jgi:DNA-binding CsgD family transcriptional regulator
VKNSPLKYVLLTDVAGSRQIGDRRSFEKRLDETLKEVQQLYAPVFEMPIQVWKGLDEAAALLKEPWQLYKVMDHIDDSIAPHKMRFVVVKGSVDVVPTDGNIARADGEAFHLAAARMLALKRDGLKFSCHTGNEAFDKAWSAQLNLLWLLKSGWTERQRTVYRMYNETGRQEEVARRLHISQQQVSKTLKSIAAAQVQALEKTSLDWAEKELKN